MELRAGQLAAVGAQGYASGPVGQGGVGHDGGARVRARGRSGVLQAASWPRLGAQGVSVQCGALSGAVCHVRPAAGQSGQRPGGPSTRAADSGRGSRLGGPRSGPAAGGVGVPARQSGARLAAGGAGPLQPRGRVRRLAGWRSRQGGRAPACAHSRRGCARPQPLLVWSGVGRAGAARQAGAAGWLGQRRSLGQQGRSVIRRCRRAQLRMRAIMHACWRVPPMLDDWPVVVPLALQADWRAFRRTRAREAR
jgi:hypothetical protein